MVYYLSLDGVDDYVVTPTFSYDKIVIDFMTNGRPANFSKLFAVNSDYVQHNSSGTDSYSSAGISSVKLNGVTVTNTTDFIPDSVRSTVEAIRSITTAYPTFIFRNYISGGFLKGNLYGAQFYLGSTLIASYDFTAGNVNDISGNGRHATLTGGTWVVDSSSGSSGSVAYATKQRVYTTSSSLLSTKQIVSRSSSAAYASKQCIYQSGLSAQATRQAISFTSVSSLATKQMIGAISTLQVASKQIIRHIGADPQSIKQVIYHTGSVSYASLQAITDDGVPGNVPFKSKQVIYGASSSSHKTKQSIFTIGEVIYPLKQIIFDSALRIVGRTPLKASRVLSIPLIASRSNIRLLASRSTQLMLKGGLSVTEKNQNFTMFAGDTENIPVTFTDNRSPVNLSGATVQWSMKRVNAATNILEKDTVSGVTITDEAAGVFTVLLSPEDTENLNGTYSHKAKVIDAAGNVSTVMTGKVTIVKS
ncbi:hypothetical protein [Paenibacillus oryzisoli]|uniref:Uncharacterized protein n=1 Tax=Paenibacillus oryzisoli TaxID=1850517 RepID=A0A198AJC8_9BACL|nr:hypothetical protein [Paenibacillus oryzisoli]OAS21156.1 hypothetical protein A8708_30155 [Paenibacillus oryzisoli]